MTTSELALIIGSEAFEELTEAERIHIASIGDSTKPQATALAAFNLLRKKFRPSYKMGRMHENESDKFEFYDKLYKELASTTSAGRRPIATNVRKNPFV